jgi:toxin ParE1/3/4
VGIKLRLSLDAEADLEHIRDTILAENPRAAERVRTAIAAAIELLNRFPNIGRPGSVEGTREKPVRSMPYIIVYEVAADELIILRVYHGAQSRP